MAATARAFKHAAAELRHVVRAEGTHHARLRDRVTVILLATVGVDVVCAVLAYLFEHNEKGTEINTFGDAIFWTSTQLLTVSSQISNPFSTGGRLLDVFMELWAVSVVTSLAGAVGAFFVHRAAEDTGVKDTGLTDTPPTS